MKPEPTYRVRRSDSLERAYQLHELTWLWRTAELPHDAEYLDSEGRWRPVNELVEPILAQQSAAEKESPAPTRPHRTALWFWAIAIAVLAASGAMTAPELQHKYRAWQMARDQENQDLQREQEARKQDFIASNVVIPNMTHEEVRRIIGEPRAIKATGDKGMERWVYKTQVIIFQDGKVVGVESPR